MTSFDDAFRGRRVLITGHTGFKGAWLTTWLLLLGAEVCGYSNGIPTRPALFEDAGLGGRIRHVIGDIRQQDVFADLVQSFKPDFVFHLAAQAIVSASYLDPLETVSSNVLGTASVLNALRGVNWHCSIIVVTSDKCYENVEQPWGYREIDAMGGSDVYSASKGATEIITTSFQRSFFSKQNSWVRVASARAGNVLGGGDWARDRIVADCIRAWNEGRLVELRRPSSTRPWQHVLEPLSGYLSLAASLANDATFNGETFNFGPDSEQNRTVLELLQDLSKTWGLGEAKAYRVNQEASFHEAGLLKLNCDKALLRLSWRPTLNYGECVGMTGRWYKEVVQDGMDAYATTVEQIKTYESLAFQRHRSWLKVS